MSKENPRMLVYPDEKEKDSLCRLKSKTHTIRPICVLSSSFICRNWVFAQNP